MDDMDSPPRAVDPAVHFANTSTDSGEMVHATMSSSPSNLQNERHAMSCARSRCGSFETVRTHSSGGSDSTLPGLSDGLVPVSSSPISSSPMAATTPPDIDEDNTSIASPVKKSATGAPSREFLQASSCTVEDESRKAYTSLSISSVVTSTSVVLRPRQTSDSLAFDSMDYPISRCMRVDARPEPLQDDGEGTTCDTEEVEDSDSDSLSSAKCSLSQDPFIQVLHGRLLALQEGISQATLQPDSALSCEDLSPAFQASLNRSSVQLSDGIAQRSQRSTSESSDTSADAVVRSAATTSENTSAASSRLLVSGFMVHSREVGSVKAASTESCAYSLSRDEHEHARHVTNSARGRTLTPKDIHGRRPTCSVLRPANWTSTVKSRRESLDSRVTSGFSKRKASDSMAPNRSGDKGQKRQKIVESRFFKGKDKENQLSSQDGPARRASKKTRAKRPATLRRADSLRSEVSHRSSKDKDKNYGTLENVDETMEDMPISTSSVEYSVPTAPVSPVKQRMRSPKSHGRSRDGARTASSGPVPAIAPPPFEDIPRAPLSNEEAAEKRLARLVDRERDMRRQDGLEQRSTGSNMKAEITDEVLELRNEIVEWILDAEPPTDRKRPNFGAHLRDQLKTSPVTRFHGAYIFLRYFHLVHSSGAVKSLAQGADLESEGMEAVMWDVGVACIALAVKFHRDALPPLFIILPEEFVAMAPHEMEEENLETAEKDVLQAVDYCLGSATPDAYMAELHVALSSLQRLVDGDRRSLREVAEREAWAVLFQALQREDVLSFPISLLTSCALLHGITEALGRRYTEDAMRASGGTAGPCRCAEVRRRAKRRVEKLCLRQDLQEVLHNTEERLQQCKAWLEADG